MSSLIDGFLGLSKDVNKVREADSADSVASHEVPELTLEMDDKELIDLKRSWLKEWDPYEGEIKAKQDQNEKYWLGEHFGKSQGPVDNVLFEALETFLPLATRPKADPIVESDNSEAGNEVADKVRKMLAFLADQLGYNLKLKQVARYWALYQLGVMKVGWSMKENDITCVAVRPQKLILDPKATIEDCEYTGYYIGERLDGMASDLVIRFPKQKDFISQKVNGKMGTKLEYIMWTTDDYLFWTLDDIVLDKAKNPHWNYDTQSEPSVSVNEFGEEVEVPGEDIPGRNHFKSRKKPYIFLSIFNIGKRPHDDTNLIQQNIPLQDLINKRLLQIDRNADNANTGIAVSGDAFTEEQAQNIANQRRKGGVPWIPSGKPSDAIMDLPAQALPSFVYESLIDYRNELRNIFGTRGSTPQGTMKEQTLGGKQIIKGQDTDRIGGGISTYLEQFSDNVFNWFVQLMYVYYDEPHYASVLGAERAKEYIELTNGDLLDLKLLVGVKEGSMIPHDPVEQRSEAVDLWTKKALDPITLFDRLEFPNPREAAKQLFLWNTDPIALFPDLLQEQQERMAQEQAMQQEQQTLAQQEEEARMAEEADLNHEREKEKMGLKALMS